MPDNHQSATATPDQELHAKIEQYTQHLEAIARNFNEHSRSIGLGVRMDAETEISAIRSGKGLNRAMRFVDRPDDSGVLHEPQMMTALNCIMEILTSPDPHGLVLGAMQSGKTTTSLALQFAGPTVYLLTGKRIYPIYLITSHTSQEDQTLIELQRFLTYYGELRIYVDERHPCKLIDYVLGFRDPAFLLSPNVNMYREHVLKDALKDVLIGPRLDDFIQRRSAGEGIRRVADLCRRAHKQGFEPLLIIDEPQYGASDRFVEIDGQIERRPCVLVQIFRQIEEVLGPDAPPHRFIGLSATPYELHDLQRVWRVSQFLSSAYRGFNYFGGRVIDADTTVAPPRTFTFRDFGNANGVPFLGSVSLAAYDASPRAFDRFAKKIRYSGTQDQYRLQVENALRATILHLATSGTRTDVGICVRLFNSNRKSHQLIQNLRLGGQVEVIEYFGSEHRGHSVKRAIEQRTRPGTPYLIAVTNRARMGDAFPASVEWFLEFSHKATDLNALLQGLLGRACGYLKNSTVIMSEENVRLVRDYERTNGGYIYKPSRHSKIVGGYRRGAPTSLIRLRADTNDPMLRRYFSELQARVLDPMIRQNHPDLSVKRAKGPQKYRTGPILRAAEEIGLFDYLERKDVRERLFPTYPEFHIARAGDRVVHTRHPDKSLGYTLDPDGNCRFTFRWTKDGEHGGARSRGYGSRDADDRERAGDTLEPQVNVRKFDPLTGDPIDDKELPNRAPGIWRATMVTLPLISPVRELEAGEKTLPIETSAYAALTTDVERDEAEYSSAFPRAR